MTDTQTAALANLTARAHQSQAAWVAWANAQQALREAIAAVEALPDGVVAPFPPAQGAMSVPTPAELRALRAYLDTGSASEAAVKLGISAQTIKNHLAKIREKLGVANTSQAIFRLAPLLATLA